jgi:hypothetical protein
MVLLVSGIVLFLSCRVVGLDYKEPETDLPAKFSEPSAKPAENTELPVVRSVRDKQLNDWSITE